MLGVSNAKEVINQLSTQQFLCDDEMMITSNYIIIKKSLKVTSGKVRKAINEMKGEKS